ncbi:MAG: DNA topoisomerase 3 [Eubacteriales bacterium]|nr:DNA topoisomerase 3 [Eubacteriales bacterium]
MHNLVIAEKPSVAQSIAKVLGASRRKDGYLEGNGYLISWCIGHLVELSPADVYNEKYEKWSLQDLPIFPSSWKYQISSGKTKQFRILKELMHRQDVENIICATDAGREGELIFRQVYYETECEKPFLRLWISSMEDTAIREGFSSLRPGSEYDNLYRSALARSQADWLVGINSTRLFTSLYGTLLRVGRVQTPVLSMICDRSEQIEHFVKQPYWNVHLDCGAFSVHREKLLSIHETDALVKRCQGNTVTITSVQKEQKSISPPRLYDLTTLQREANRYYGYTAQQTLDITQSLYEKKYVTYPRTDSQYLTNDMAGTAEKMVRLIQNLFAYDTSIYPWEPDIKRILNNSKVTDHHAIIPTTEISNGHISDLSKSEKDILLLISQRLLCATAPKHRFEETLLTALCAGENFTAKGKIILEPGWKAIESAFRRTLKSAGSETSAKDSSLILPPITEGSNFSDVISSVTDHFTSPPKPYSEDTLLSAMETAGNEDFNEDTEKKGLGTPATRANILEKLVKSGYVQRKGKNLLPTPDGKNLISVMPDSLKSPKMTAEWENTLMQIEHGMASDQIFLQGIQNLVSDLVRTHEQISPDNQKQFAISSGKEELGSCPFCQSAVYEGKTNYYCSNRNCSFRLWKNSTFLEKLKKPMTKKMAVSLLHEGRIHARGLYSTRTGKNFDADILLTETTDKEGKRISSFKLEFPSAKM